MAVFFYRFPCCITRPEITRLMKLVQIETETQIYMPFLKYPD